jgi:hypothetical protein
MLKIKLKELHFADVVEIKVPWLMN